MRLRVSAALVAVLVGAMGTLGAAPAPAQRASSGCAGGDLIPTPGNTATIRAAALCLIDQVRTAHHLRPLRANRELQTVAAAEAGDMLRGNYFADNSPHGQTLAAHMAASHYLLRVATSSTAQNIGWGTLTNATPARMVEAWMRSPPHRRIILTGEYRDAGVGVIPAVPAAVGGGLGGATWTVDFGVRRP